MTACLPALFYLFRRKRRRSTWPIVAAAGAFSRPQWRSSRFLDRVSRNGSRSSWLTHAGIQRETLCVVSRTPGHREVVAWPTWTWDRQRTELREEELGGLHAWWQYYAYPMGAFRSGSTHWLDLERGFSRDVTDGCDGDGDGLQIGTAPILQSPRPFTLSCGDRMIADHRRGRTLRARLWPSFFSCFSPARCREGCPEQRRSPSMRARWWVAD